MSKSNIWGAQMRSPDPGGLSSGMLQGTLRNPEEPFMGRSNFNTDLLSYAWLGRWWAKLFCLEAKKNQNPEYAPGQRPPSHAHQR